MRLVVPVILVISLCMPLTSAQTPSGEWNIDWENDNEPEILQLDTAYNFDIKIKFWIDNSRPVPAEIQFESESNDAFSVDDPGSVSVPANSNETFEITITGSGIEADIGLYDARGEFFDVVTLTASLMVGGQPSDTKEIEKKLQFSPVYELDFPMIEDIDLELKAGTNKEITVDLENLGNKNDAIKKIDFTFKSCPQMDYEEKSGILVEGYVSDFRSVSTAMISLDAPSSHPDKICELNIAVTSEGNGVVYVGKLEFSVVAPEIVTEKEVEDNQEVPTDSPSDENQMPFQPFFYSLLCVIFAALSRR